MKGIICYSFTIPKTIIYIKIWIGILEFWEDPQYFRLFIVAVLERWDLEIVVMIQSYYVCSRFVTVGLGSRWHNWSPNVATVTGWTFLPNREVPVLWDIRCINNQTPGKSSSTRVCLATAAGILLISPANMQRTNAIVRRGKFPSVFYSCDHLGEFAHRFYVHYYTERHSKRYFVLQNIFYV